MRAYNSFGAPARDVAGPVSNGGHVGANGTSVGIDGRIRDRRSLHPGDTSPLASGKRRSATALRPLVTNPLPDAGARCTLRLRQAAANKGPPMHHRHFPARSCWTMLACAVVATVVALPAAAVAADSGTVDETARTPAAVMAVDQHWLEAEMGGNTTWLDAMLLPDYRTVGSDGKVGTKSRILANAKKNRGSDAMRKQVDAWLKTHPSKQSVVMQGDVAILSFSDPKTGRIRSSDTFVYVDGGWHALYSQHSKVE